MKIRTYDTPEKRLMAVAEDIELEPEYWNQQYWCRDTDLGSELTEQEAIEVAHDRAECGTTMCVAGHGTVRTPWEELAGTLAGRDASWFAAGMVAFDLGFDAASALFMATGVNDRHVHPMEPRSARVSARWTF